MEHQVPGVCVPGMLFASSVTCWVLFQLVLSPRHVSEGNLVPGIILPTTAVVYLCTGSFHFFVFLRRATRSDTLRVCCSVVAGSWAASERACCEG